MVRVVRSRPVIYSCVLAVICALVWIAVPNIVVDKPDAHVRLLRDAVLTYQVDNGAFPDSLVQAEPYLETATRTDCVIKPDGESRYKVEMPVSGGRTYYMDATYALGSSHEWEVFDVHITDVKRTR